MNAEPCTGVMSIFVLAAQALSKLWKPCLSSQVELTKSEYNIPPCLLSGLWRYCFLVLYQNFVIRGLTFTVFEPSELQSRSLFGKSYK